MEFKITAKVVMTDMPMPEGFDPNGNAYKVTLRSRVTGRQYTVPFFMGSALTDEPSAAEVLNSLALDAGCYYNASGYYDFCEEFGYDSDDSRYRKMYDGCRKAYDRLCVFVGVTGTHDLIMKTESL